MRILSAAAQEMLSDPLGLEPINMVDINFSLTGTDEKFIRRYSDREMEGVRGSLLELSSLENVLNLSGNTSSQAITIKLSDTDGELKTFFNTVDLHKRMVYVYQSFIGLPFSDRFLIFEGQISSPITWREGDRTLSFQVVSKIEDMEVGFAIEDGDFTDIPKRLIGKVWPLPFGFVSRLPAIQIDEIPRSLTAERIGILTKEADDDKEIESINLSLEKLQLEQAAAYQNGLDLLAQATAISNQFLVTQDLAKQKDLEKQAEAAFKTAVQYQNQAATLKKDISDKQKKIVNEEKLALDQKTQFSVVGGYQYGIPAGTSYTIDVNGATYQGGFTPSQFVFGPSKISPYDNTLTPLGPLQLQDNDQITKYEHAQSEDQGFFFAFGGQPIRITNGLWCNYLLCQKFVDVKLTYAYRDFGDGNKFLFPVPPGLVVPKFVQFGDIQATILVVPRVLSSLGQGWSDELFCDIQSPLGANPVDVMTYLINTYTNKTYDVNTFTDVRNRLIAAQIQMNFALTKRANVVKILEEIAFQARCSIWYSNGVFYLKYMAANATPVMTITESDIEFGTLEITSTETEDLITKMVVNWRQAYNLDTYEFIYRHNVLIYGLQEFDFDFYAYTQQGFVDWGAIFWLIRRSNTWKRVRFDTFMNKMALEPFDTVLLSFSTPYVCNTDVPAIIEQVQLDTTEMRVHVQAWIPVRFGEMDIYDFAIPADLDATFIFPTPEMIQLGTAGGGQSQKASGTLPTTGATNIENSHTFNHSDKGPGIPINDGSVTVSPFLATTSSPITVGTKPSDDPNAKNNKQYVVKTYAAPVADLPAPGVFPGQVDSKIEKNTYNVWVYFNGIQNQPEKVKVVQLLIREDDEITPTTPCMVTRALTYATINGKQLANGIEYTMQVPVWLGPLPDPNGGDTGGNQLGTAGALGNGDGLPGSGSSTLVGGGGTDDNTQNSNTDITDDGSSDNNADIPTGGTDTPAVGTGDEDLG